MSKHSAKTGRKSSPKVRIERSGKHLTTYAGLVPVIRFLEKLKFHDLFRRTVDHQRIGDNAEYRLEDGVFMSLLSIIAGARSMSGISLVWADRVLCRLAGKQQAMSETSLGRLFKTVCERHICQLEQFNHVLRGRSWKRARCFSSALVRRNVWIDVDSTVKTVYGSQEGSEIGYNPHKRGARSYHPLLAFCADTKEILQGWLRCGSAYTSNGIVEFMRQLSAHMPQQMRIVFRGDSGFFVGELLEWLDQSGYGYLIKVKMRNLVGLLDRQSWQHIQGKPGWQQTTFRHRCGKWKRERTFVAVRRLKESNSRQPGLFDMHQFDYFCYVTSENLTPWQTHKKYGARATCETWIDEAKNQMGLGHIKTSEFLANSVLFQCSILAYNTVRWMALISGNAQLARWEMMTVRAFMVRMAGKLVSGSRQLTLKIPQELLHPEVWQSWLRVGMS